MGDPKVMGFNILQCSNFGWLGVPPHFRKPPYIYYILLLSKSLEYLKCFNLGLLISNCYSHAIVTVGEY